MVDAAPFRGLRYDPALAGDPASTSAPAYDDVDAFTYTSHRTAGPYTVLELLTPADESGGFRSAAATLRRWRRTGVLVPEAAPAFYRYEEHELRRGIPHVQRGLLAAVALEEPGPGASILPHEEVDPARVARRRARLQQLEVDVSPVFALAVGRSQAFGRVLARPPSMPPVVALTDEAGVDHRVWAVTGPEQVAELREQLAPLTVLIADGHHRYAAALQAREHRRHGAWRRTLMYVVDASSDGPEVLGVHRLVRGLTREAIRRLADDFGFEEVPADPVVLRERVQTAATRSFGLLLAARLAGARGPRALLLRPRDERWLASRLPPERSARWRGLDTALLDRAVLPALRPDGVEYRPDLASAAADVAAADDAALFVLRPVDLDTVVALATAREPLPAKSTYFRPKPRAGLVLRPLGDP